MYTKIILLLLNGALILQSSNANDVTSINDTRTKTDSFEDLSALTTTSPYLSSQQIAIDKLYYDRLRTIFRAVDEFYFLTYDVIRTGRKLFGDVLVDLQNTTMIGKTSRISAKISELQKYNDKVDNFKPCEDYHVKIHINALKLFFDQLNALNATTMENPSSIDTLVDSLLRKNGFQTVEQAAVLRLSEYMEKLSKKLNEFEESLHDREVAVLKDVKAWLLELHDLKAALVQFTTRQK